ncbi:hypothetical protein DOY81_004928 [Sarcophaga bullata]|nr:hypothetical protein DOY81_004928 [Sarcophaga bullata]
MTSFKLIKKIIVLSILYVLIREIQGTRTDESKRNETSDARTIYDQRQNGKYNIHVVIKDVAIIEMDQNGISEQTYNDDDYYYDEDDLTVKPLKPTVTTLKPLYSSSVSTTQTTISSIKEQNDENSSSPSLLSTLFPITESHNIRKDDEYYMPIVNIKARSKVEPIYAIEETQGIQHQALLRQGIYIPNDETQKKTNSKIYKLRMHHFQRSQIPQNKRYHSNQYKKSRSNCRENISASGSILNRLLGMLVTLPFRREQYHSNN